MEANLAEGCGRRGDGEMARFVQISMDSASELDCHLLIARDLGFMQAVEHSAMESELSRIRRMLTSFLQTILASGESAQVKAKSPQPIAKSQKTGV
jgi:four helix bundle protein